MGGASCLFEKRVSKEGSGPYLLKRSLFTNYLLLLGLTIRNAIKKITVEIFFVQVNGNFCEDAPCFVFLVERGFMGKKRGHRRKVFLQF